MEQIVTERVVLVGAGGFAREVLQFLEDIDAAGRSIRCEFCVVEHGYGGDARVQGIAVLEGLNSLNHRHTPVAIAIGTGESRSRIAATIERECVGVASIDALVHPTAVVGRKVTFGVGTIVAPLSSATTNVTIGRHVQLHVGATIGHDVVIGDFVTLCPRSVISGGIRIGEGAFVGAGAIILPDLEIGSWATIGAGAVVTRNVASRATVVGNPARPMNITATE